MTHTLPLIIQDIQHCEISMYCEMIEISSKSHWIKLVYVAQFAIHCLGLASPWAMSEFIPDKLLGIPFCGNSD